MKINMIVARSKNHVIGLEGKIPWHIPEDFAWFREKTTSHAIIMGRNTFTEIGKPLKNRLNVVLSTNRNHPDLIKHAKESNFLICGSMIEAIEKLKDLGLKECFIIGGSTLYNNFISQVDNFYLTEVDTVIKYNESDNVTKFDYIFLDDTWYKSYSQTQKTKTHSIEFIHYKRKH